MKKCNNPNCEFEGELLSLTEFFKNKCNKDGYSHRCKKCVRKSAKISYYKNHQYYLDKSKEYVKEYREKNPKKYKEVKKKNSKKLMEKGYWKKYYQENKERLSEYSKMEEVGERRRNRWRERYKNDEKFRLKEIMKSNFHLFFKDKGLKKDLSFSKIMNYTYGDLKNHLENNFREGMTWENFGELWEIHHIKPQNLFNPKVKKEVKECWGLNNLIPLWKTTQISHLMGDNIEGNRNISKTEIYNPNKI